MTQPTRIVPVFSTEAEDADWWFENRDAHDRDMTEAAANGELTVVTRNTLLTRLAASGGSKPIRRPQATPVDALRIPAEDLALARKQAEEKGLPYQTYIQSLLHETLLERELRSRA